MKNVITNQPAQSGNSSWENRGMFVTMLWFFIGYGALSCLTVPFTRHFWIGEIPTLALIQMPKILMAEWLRTHVVMEMVKFLGFSSGSFSPDYILARPYALALAYLLVMVIIGGIGWCFRFHFTDRQWRFVVTMFLATAIIDYLLTLTFTKGPGFTIYG